MKKLFSILIIMFVLFGFNIADAKSQHPHRGKHQTPTYNKHYQDKQFYHHDGRQKYHGWAQYHGHYEKPHNYQHRVYHHRPDYRYEGHWSSWNDWERYYMKNPYIHRHGRYEKHGEHLFFLIDDGIYKFMFSIGR